MASEEETLPLSKRRGLSMEDKSASPVAFVEGPLSVEDYVDDRVPYFGCGLRFVLSKLCMSPGSKRESTFRKRQKRISPFTGF